MGKNKELEAKLKVGTKIKIGEKYAVIELGRFCPGEIIQLVEGFFECENGLYSYTDTAPSIWNEDEYDSIYHLFGTDLEYFLDCEIVD